MAFDLSVHVCVVPDQPALRAAIRVERRLPTHAEFRQPIPGVLVVDAESVSTPSLPVVVE